MNYVQIAGGNPGQADDRKKGRLNNFLSKKTLI